MHVKCHRNGCEGFEVDSFDIDAAFDIKDQHDAAHREADRPTETHIRTQIDPRRVKGNSFYKVKLSSSEDGSQTLCGAPATTEDIGYGEGRHAKNLAYVTCETCKTIRAAK